MRQHTLVRLWLFVFVVLVIVLSGSILLAAGASAQTSPDGSQGEATNATQSPDAPTRIDQNTVIHESGYDSDTGMAWVVVESDVPQRIVVNDVGSFVEGGEVPRKRVRVPPDEKVRIEVRYHRSRGIVALAVSTRQVLHSEIIDEDSLINQPKTHDGVALLSGIFVSFGGMIQVNRLYRWYTAWGVHRVDG